jgi:dynein heavy chain
MTSASYVCGVVDPCSKFVLMAGPTGTGKTANLVELLSSEMPAEYIPLALTFSAQTSANQTQVRG